MSYELQLERATLGERLHQTEQAIGEGYKAIREILATNERPLPPEPLALMGIHRAQILGYRQQRDELLDQLGQVKRELNPPDLQWQAMWLR